MLGWTDTKIIGGASHAIFAWMLFDLFQGALNFIHK